LLVFRSLVRQWKRKTDNMTEAAIKTKFHLADVNGDGRLNPKEFKKLLKSFGMELPAADVEILIERFDVDGDGDIDLHEFRAFIESEQKNLFEATATSTAPAKSAALLPPPKAKSYGANSPVGRSVDDGGTLGAATRPTTAAGGRNNHLHATHAGGALPRRPASAPRSRLNATAPGGLESSPGRTLGRSVTIQSPRKATDDGPVRMSSSLYGADPYADTVDEDPRSDHLSIWKGDRVGATVADMPSLRKQRASGGASGIADTADDAEVGDEDVDVLWVARMLQAQAEVEARIGKRYYS
jgi:hypothetical protein